MNIDLIGHVVGFELEPGGDSDSIKVGPGIVQLLNGGQTFYAGQKVINKAAGRYRLSFLDPGLADQARNRDRPLNRTLLADEYTILAETSPGLDRGVYAGGLVVVCDDAKIPDATGGHVESGSRKERTYLNIIGALITLIVDNKTTGGKRYSSINTQANLIELLEAQFPNKGGITKRTLEQKFAAARQSITQD